MKFFGKLSAKKNTDRLLGICMDLIDQYESENLHGKPSCKADMRELLQMRFKNAEDEIAEWKDYNTDYIRIAHSMLAQTTFDLLASGKYHIYTGVLNPLSCASNLLSVYNKAMEYGVNAHLITEETREEQYNYLHQCIASVG